MAAGRKIKEDVGRPSFTYCETVAAIVWHIRQLSDAGPKYSGGADTRTLCGGQAAWDIQCEINEATLKARPGEPGRPCKVCAERYKEMTNVTEG